MTGKNKLNKDKTTKIGARKNEKTGTQTISGLIKKSKIGKDMDPKILKAIDMVFEKAVTKTVAKISNKKVALEKHKYKMELLETIDSHIEKIVAEKTKHLIADQAKIRIANKIVESFKSSFSEIFMTEGSNKLSESLKKKIAEVSELETTHRENMNMMRRKFEKQIKDLNSKLILKEKKYQLGVKKMKLNEAKSLIESNNKLSLTGKTNLINYIKTKVDESKLNKDFVSALMERYIKREGIAGNDKQSLKKRIAERKMKDRKLSNDKDGGANKDENVSAYTKELDKMG